MATVAVMHVLVPYVFHTGVLACHSVGNHAPHQLQSCMLPLRVCRLRCAWFLACLVSVFPGVERFYCGTSSPDCESAGTNLLDYWLKDSRSEA